MAGERDARVGERDRPAVPFDQRGPALAFEGGQLLGHRGRAQGRGVGHGADRPEALQLDQQAKAAWVEHCSAQLYSQRRKCRWTFTVARVTFGA